jgi:hypothetical protein
MISVNLKNTYQQFTRIIEEFRVLWKNYLYQSFLATVVTFIVFWILSTEEAVIVASIGATAFIVFTMPTYLTTKPKRVIGGHSIGLLCGIVGVFFTQHFTITPIIVYSVVVGLSILLMVALDFEHPPASGTALGVAIRSIDQCRNIISSASFYEKTSKRPSITTRLSVECSRLFVFPLLATENPKNLLLG